MLGPPNSRRGRAVVPIIIIVGSIVVFCFMVWGVLSPFLYPQDQFVKVSLAGHDTLWVQFRGGSFRYASRPDALEKAPFHSMQGVTKLPVDTSPAIYVGRSPRDADVESRPGVYLTPGVGPCYVTWRVDKTDASGETWHYAFANEWLDAGESAAAAAAVPVPATESTDLELTALPEPTDSGTKFDISLSVTAGDLELGRATRGTQPVKALVSVIDASGKTVASKRGDLSAFGST